MTPGAERSRLIEPIAADREHGAAWLSLRALELLRDCAARLESEGASRDAAEQLRALALELRAARPAMAVIRNRVNRLMHATRGADFVAFQVAARRELVRAAAADDAAAARAAPLAAGRRVFTLSRSATVAAALRAADPAPTLVLISESLPGGEGQRLADELQTAGLSVELVPDGAVGPLLAARRADLVLVGADGVLPEGAVINKTGTRTAAEAAAAAGIPCYAVAAADKVGEATPAGDAVAGNGDETPLFEVTPAGLWRAVVTEVGALDAEGIAQVAAGLGTLEDW